MEKTIIYTNETCPYCKQVKEEFDKNNLEYEERLITKYEADWTEVNQLTGLPAIPTVFYKDNYFVPGRDFRGAAHLFDVINSLSKIDGYKFSYEKQLTEKIKTLTYQVQASFGRTDQLLRQIENKLNIKE